MEIEVSKDIILLTVSSLLGLILTHYLVSQFITNGLNRYPGPWLANFSKFWLRWDVQTNRHQRHLLELHRTHGDVVRVGPNNLSIANPDYVALIYGVKNEFLKSEMYDAFAPRVNGKPAVSWLSVREPNAHARIKKPIASAYSLTVLKEYEPLVDDMIKKFMNRLEVFGRDEGGKTCDMAIWLRLYAFDVIMHLTFSDTMGFLDVGGDIDNWMALLDENGDRSGLLITMPWTAWLVKHNPIYGWFVRDSTIFTAWARGFVQKRMDARQKTPSSAPTDFLDRFLDAGSREGAADYDIPLIMNWTIANVMAGADTTATGLRAILYYLLKFPSKKEKLLHELRSADLKYPVAWDESQKLPYLDACIKEAFRLHPVIALGLERTVPASGLELPDGYILPPGTNVSINPWVLNRLAVFGNDPDEFIPERWLQQKEERTDQYEERIGIMKRADLTFGGGSRTCPGKYISLLEIYKVIPTLMLQYDIGLVDEAGEWTTINRWVMRQENIGCWLRRKSR